MAFGFGSGSLPQEIHTEANIGMTNFLMVMVVRIYKSEIGVQTTKFNATRASKITWAMRWQDGFRKIQ